MTNVLRTLFEGGSWWAYDDEYESKTGPYSTEEQAQDFIDAVRG